MPRFFRPLNLLALMLFLGAALFVMGFESIVYAEGDTPNKAPTEQSKVVKATPSPQALELKLDSHKVLPDPKSAANKNFDSAKEARLEDLRYKHLWIAYSMVWIVIFVFIRQTWQRSQAVSGRLEELKSRLIALEEKEK
ncbi:MAG: hypothetical protein CMH49_01105 [Myxococcales bacterium]|nr:hypothetical protein [Myxococcales bacterium]